MNSILERTLPFIAIILSIFLLWTASPDHVSFGNEPAEDKKASEDKKEVPKETAKCEETATRTVHHLMLEGDTLQYTATAGIYSVQRESTSAAGCIFYVAYVLQETSHADRPLTFAFNGGPGAASVWLHMGGLGPKRVVIGEQGEMLPPPARYESNPFTWLEFTDLVFVDTVGTGFSRSVPDTAETRQKFYGVEQDIEIAAEFIRIYVTENQRWLSPLYLVGESYGGTRVSSLTGYLQKTCGIDLKAAVLISPALDFNTFLFHPSNDLPYLLYLPTYAATAWYHKKGGDKFSDLERFLESVERFCMDTYAGMLVKGDALSAEEKQSLEAKLVAYTGLSAESIQKSHYRVGWGEFSRRLLEDRNRVIGRMDGTISGKQRGKGRTHSGYDPSLDSLYGLFSGTINHYLRTELKFETDRIYEFLNPKVNRGWDWSSGVVGAQGFVDVSQTLADTMTVNNYLRTFIATGVYDLSTPYFATEYTVRHMWLEDRQERITVKQYRSGHMVYLNRKALENLYQDVRNFYSTTLERRTHSTSTD